MNVSDLLEQMRRFDDDPSSFLVNLLAAQCVLSKAGAGAIIHSNTEQNINVLAVHPKLEKGIAPPSWLTESTKLLQQNTEQTATLKPLENSSDDQTSAKNHIAIIPLKMVEISNLTAVFYIETEDQDLLEEIFQKLQLVTEMMNYSQTRFAKLAGEGRLKRLQQAMEILSDLNQQDEFTSASMSLCNEIASQWQCQRVSVGFLKGRYVQLKAMSHIEDFSRKMKAIQDIESAMEESLDQDIEVLSPALDDSTYISRAADQLSQKYGPQTVLSLPLRQKGDVIGVLTLERPADKLFTSDEIETIRLTCELCTARLNNLYEYNRWIGATIALKTRNFFARFLSPKHTLAKALTIIIFASILFSVFVKGQFRPKAPFILEAIQQQVIPAPFDGYIKSVAVEVGDSIEGKDSVLASLDDAELRLQLAAAKAEKTGYLKQESAYMRDNETAQSQIARANADKTQAAIDLLNYQINQANLISPINGIVVKGDLKRQIGAPVKTGDILFEVCPLKSLRGQLMVPEDLIFDIKVGQKGKLATASYPGQAIEFEVERINPMAEVVNQRNVFKVRVRLLEMHPWMRPGMEGVAKVSVGKRPYIWIWTRKINNWIRMKLWL
ncbi:MAG: HlyD family efflux transporter periplasmic adaptor subunit [Planctomycetes bacterium]|nr:HlyD family efflux transporter periplasmic adaptor subunit [Planctomycetota bacterium]